MSDLFETEIDSGSKCKKGHALTLVAEGDLRSREDCLALIQADIDAHRSLPFDEEAERARLVAV